MSVLCASEAVGCNRVKLPDENFSIYGRSEKFDGLSNFIMVDDVAVRTSTSPFITYIYASFINNNIE